MDAKTKAKTKPTSSWICFKVLIASSTKWCAWLFGEFVVTAPEKPVSSVVHAVCLPLDFYVLGCLFVRCAYVCEFSDQPLNFMLNIKCLHSMPQ